MSILNGAVSAAVIHTEPPPFGRLLQVKACLPLPGCADVTVSPDGRTAYAVCRDRLVVYALDAGGLPGEKGSIGGRRPAGRSPCRRGSRM